MGLRVAPRRDGSTSPHDNQQYGLENIGQMCASKPVAEWSSLVTAHFNSMLQSRADHETTANLTWDELQPRLGIRLMEITDHSMFDWSLWREDLPGIASMVFVDEPTAITNLKRDRVIELGVLTEHVFENAFDNLQSLAPVKRSAFPLEEGGEIVLLEGESPFAAAHALHLERHVGVLGRHGAFISVPTRHTVLVLPFNDLYILRTLQHLLNIAAIMHRDGPGSISTNVYWIHNEDRIQLPYKVTERGAAITPPDELTEFLNRLAEAEEGA
ncbi:MAG: hypothetical protein QM783_05845 [Phycisphaerales bacterium]